MLRRRPIHVIVALLLALAISDGATAAPRIRWTRDVAHPLHAVGTDGVRSVLVTGYRQVGVHIGTWDRALVLRRYRSDGEPIWTRRWNPEREARAGDAWDVTAQGEALALGSGGEVLVAGNCWVDIESSAWFLRAYTRHGGLLWNRAPGLQGKEAGFGTATAVAVRGDVVVVAGSSSLWPGSDGWLRAYDLEGRLRWHRDFEVPGLRRFSDRPAAVAIGALGNVYVAGQVATSSEYWGGPPYHEMDHEIVVQKLTSSGRRLWTRVLRDAPTRADYDTATSIALRGDRVAVAGVVNSDGRRASRLWLGAFTTGGHLEWRRVWGHVPAGEPGPSTAIQPSGSIVVAGSVRDRSDDGMDAFVRRFAPGGRRRWALTLPEDARYVVGTGIVVSGRNTIYVSGYLLEDDAQQRGMGRLLRIRG